MYRLMIADDEEDERMGIRFLLKKFNFPFEITEAVDGKDALEKLLKNPVDILFTDVKMPFLSGLQLSERARETVPGLQIVFFSGYDDFDYVKQALSLQAVDYILKPVNPQEFKKVLTLVLERMDRRLQEYQFQKVFILTRLFNQVPYEKLRKEYQEEELEFLQEYTRIILFEFDEEFFGKEEADIQELGRRIEKAADFPCELLDINSFQGILLLKESGRDETECRKAAERIHRLIEEEYCCCCYLAVSPEVSEPGAVGHLYSVAEQSLEDRFFYKDEFVYPLVEKKRVEYGTQKDGQLLAAIEKDLQLKDVDGLLRDVASLLGKCRNNGFQSYIYTWFVCANLLKVLYQGLPGEEKQLTVMIEKIYACSRFSDIEAVIQEIMEKLEERLTDAQDSPKHVTALVERYIHEHYMDVLSLDILADKVYLTPHYLSSVFSQEKKIGINKYIKNIRMEKADGLLRNTNMKIQDICKAVGYSNISYFCRTFRNEYGVTPEKYREQSGTDI